MVTINGKKYEEVKGQSILELCQENNIFIPTICHDERLVAHGACRLCLVDIGNRNLVAACTTPVMADMEIITNSERIEKTRKDILELMWSSHDNNCLVCSQAGNCKLQDLCYLYNIEPEKTYYKKRLNYRVDSSNDFYDFYEDKCILCGKCVRVCHELQVTGAIGFSQRGYHTHISHPFEMGMEHSNCVSCGNCVNVCPTGAIVEKKKTFRTWDVEKRVRTTCGYCGVGCQINLVIKDNQVINIEPIENEINHGLLCVKGKFAYNFINHPDRLKTPLIKEHGVFRPATWEEAYDLLGQNIKSIKAKFGPDAIGGLASARCTNEDNYMMQKLFRAVIGTHSIDHCARL